jgi:8-hydroxy-5-deazaflavin:NADPH oxidoreductase
MRVAVIGTGNIGGTLGTKWTAAGHDVVYGGRRPAVDAGPGGASIVSFEEALAFAEVVVLAVPGGAMADLVGELGAALNGKVIVDAANRMGAEEYNSYAAIKAAAPEARYVRAFNSLGWENFADPPEGAALFYAGDDETKALTEELITATGLVPAYLGDAEARKIVDGILPLWFALVTQQGGSRKLAFRIVR